MVEDGSTDVVESFVAALKDLGYWDIVALIDPPDVHRRAGKYCLNRLLKLSYCLLLFLIYFNMIEIYLKKHVLLVGQQLSIYSLQGRSKNNR